MATTTHDRISTGHVAQTTPYAWPWNGVLDATRTAVLVVEAPGDCGAVDDGSLRNAEVVVATLRRAGGVAIRVFTRRASATRPFGGEPSRLSEIGRASCRERVSRSV